MFGIEVGFAFAPFPLRKRN